MRHEEHPLSEKSGQDMTKMMLALNGVPSACFVALVQPEREAVLREHERHEE
jgi:hypothetical protein